jgi:septal ring factor EnvC (AmiA/AmiB activator)
MNYALEAAIEDARLARVHYEKTRASIAALEDDIKKLRRQEAEAEQTLARTANALVRAAGGMAFDPASLTWK